MAANSRYGYNRSHDLGKGWDGMGWDGRGCLRLEVKDHKCILDDPVRASAFATYLRHG